MNKTKNAARARDQNNTHGQAMTHKQLSEDEAQSVPLRQNLQNSAGSHTPQLNEQYSHDNHHFPPEAFITASNDDIPYSIEETEQHQRPEQQQQQPEQQQQQHHQQQQQVLDNSPPVDTECLEQGCYNSRSPNCDGYCEFHAASNRLQ